MKLVEHVHKQSAGGTFHWKTNVIVIAPPTRQSIVIIIESKMKAHNTVVHCFYSHLQENSRLCSNFNTMYKNNKHY